MKLFTSEMSHTDATCPTATVTDNPGSKPDYIYIYMFGGEIGIIVHGNCK